MCLPFDLTSEPAGAGASGGLNRLGLPLTQPRSLRYSSLKFITFMDHLLSQRVASQTSPRVIEDRRVLSGSLTVTGEHHRRELHTGPAATLDTCRPDPVFLEPT